MRFKWRDVNGQGQTATVGRAERGLVLSPRCTASHAQPWTLCVVFWCEIACCLTSEYGRSAAAHRMCCRTVSAVEVGASWHTHGRGGRGAACVWEQEPVSRVRGSLSTTGSGQSVPGHQTRSWQEQVCPCYRGHLPNQEGGFEQLHLHQGPPAMAQRSHPAQHLLL